MEIEEITLNDNPLLKRKEYVFKVTGSPVTPKKNEFLDKVCSKYTISDKSLVVLESIKNTFGMQECTAIVKIYESKEDMPVKKVKKEEGKAPEEDDEAVASEGEKPAEEAKPEKKEEDKKPEAKKEEKPKEEAPVEEPKTEEKKEE